MFAKRGFSHHHEPGALQAPLDPLDSYLGHEFGTLMNTLSPFRPTGDRDGVHEIAGIGGVSFSSITLEDRRMREHFKNDCL